MYLCICMYMHARAQAGTFHLGELLRAGCAAHAGNVHEPRAELQLHDLLPGAQGPCGTGRHMLYHLIELLPCAAHIHIQDKTRQECRKVPIRYDTIRYDTAASKQVGGAFAALDSLHGEVSKRVRDAEATDGTQSSWSDQSTTIAADFGRRRGRRERATGRRRRQWDAG